MALITHEDVFQYLDQVTVDSPNIALLDVICTRVDSIIAEYIGYSWDAYDTVASDKVVTGTGIPWLTLPPHQAGSVTSVVVEGDTTPITGYTEQDDGSLFLGSIASWAWTDYPSWSGWPAYRRYTVTAKWGNGAVPEALKEVAVELAVNLWRERDKGMFSDVIGVEGGGAVAVGYARAFTNRQKAILDIYRRKFTAPWVA